MKRRLFIKAALAGVASASVGSNVLAMSHLSGHEQCKEISLEKLKAICRAIEKHHARKLFVHREGDMGKITFTDKKPAKKKSDNQSVVGLDDDYMRNITIPANAEILDEAEIDKDVVMLVHGRISAIRNNESESYTDRSITIKASSIEVLERTSDDEDAGMKSGYKRG